MPDDWTSYLWDCRNELRRLVSSQAWLMPDNPTFLDLLRKWRQRGPERPIGEEEYWQLTSLIYYGPDAAPPTDTRYQDLQTYIHKKLVRPRNPGRPATEVRPNRPRGRRTLFRAEELPQLVFVYALGVEREPKTLSPDEHPAWGKLRWDWAVLTLFTMLERLGKKLKDRLAEFRLNEIDCDPKFKHTIGVLLEDTPCGCVDTFLKAHPKGARRREVEKRHRQRHLLKGWLNQDWPASSHKHGDVYPIGTFLFHATVGDHPHHPRGFEQGLWFPQITSQGMPLRVYRVLVCKAPRSISTESHEDTDRVPSQCNRSLASFEECSACKQPWPPNDLAYRLGRMDDEFFVATTGKRCAKCGSLSPPKEDLCRWCHGQLGSKKTNFYMRRPRDDLFSASPTRGADEDGELRYEGEEADELGGSDDWSIDNTRSMVNPSDSNPTSWQWGRALVGRAVEPPDDTE